MTNVLANANFAISALCALCFGTLVLTQRLQFIVLQSAKRVSANLDDVEYGLNHGRSGANFGDAGPQHLGRNS